MISLTKTDKILFLYASFFLCLGFFCYLFLYPYKFQTLSIGTWAFQPHKIILPSSLLVFIYSLTSYCHALFMTLFSVVISSNKTNKVLCQWGFFWGIVDSVFEILQLKTVSHTEADPNSSPFVLLKTTYHYLESGSFDGTDILFIWLGVFSAFYLCKTIRNNQ